MPCYIFHIEDLGTWRYNAKDIEGAHEQLWLELNWTLSEPVHSSRVHLVAITPNQESGYTMHLSDWGSLPENPKSEDTESIEADIQELFDFYGM